MSSETPEAKAQAPSENPNGDGEPSLEPSTTGEDGPPDAEANEPDAPADPEASDEEVAPDAEARDADDASEVPHGAESAVPALPDRVSRARRAAGWLSEHAALVTICLVLIAVGCVLRVVDLGFPDAWKFDEHHFVNPARAYLEGAVDRNDHPPLGKLLFAASMHWLGDKGIGWRFAPLIAGFVNIWLAFAIGRRAFRNTPAGLLAAAFFAADGFLLSYSRAALLDGILTCFTLCVVWVLVCPVRWWRAALAFMFVGLAGSVKMSGHALLIPVVAVYLASPLPFWVLGFAVLWPLVFYAQWATGLAISDLPHSPKAVYETARKLLLYHLSLTDMTNPATSYWYTWALPKRPLMLRFDRVDENTLRLSSSLGNPLLWWSNVAANLGLTIKLGWEGPKGTLERIKAAPGLSETSFLARHVRSVAVLVMVWGVMILPWIVTARDSYILHYLPSHAVGLTLVAGLLAHIYQRHRYAALAYLAVVAVISGWYAPVWAQLPITPDAAWMRLPLLGWR